MRGVIPLAPTLDHAGPMARTIADCSALLAAMAAGRARGVAAAAAAGAARSAARSAPRPGPRPLEGLTIALTDRPGRQALDPDVADGLEAARAACERLGASARRARRRRRAAAPST